MPEIRRFLSSGNPKIPRKVVFSTYQSLDVLRDSMKGQASRFDLAIFDEAHRTAGVKGTEMFSLGLDDKNVPATKRLFMTATEKLIRPQLREKLKANESLELFSMDDPSKYGSLLSSLNFGQAIEQGIISDYRIVVAGIKCQELFDLIARNAKFLSETLSPHGLFTLAQNVFKQILIAKCFKEIGVRKVISFHSSIKQARAFVTGSGSGDYHLRAIIDEIFPEAKGDKFYLDHVNGSLSTGKRREILDEFERAPRGLISNAQCLTEGVNLPEVDCIYFADSKHSMVDIIQACGRALRKLHGTGKGKVATFVIPVLIDDRRSEEDYLNSQDFAELHNVVQALRDQDYRLADWIDQINLQNAKGKHVYCGAFNGARTGGPPISVLAYDLDLKLFDSKITTRIATINHTSRTRDLSTPKVYGKNDRKASVTRVFRTIGDYGLESFEKNLILPTIERIRSSKKQVDAEFSTQDLKVNNNNVSHAARLGLIQKVKSGYRLSPIGIKMLSGKLSFSKVFQTQILRYAIEEDGRVLFPYAACMYLLIEREKLTFLEFVYALYSSRGSSAEEMARALKIVDYIRKEYPIVDNLNAVNRKRIIDNLNAKFNLNFKLTDIWDRKQTTINNQFIFFKNNLRIFGGLLELESSTEIRLPAQNRAKALELLNKNPFFNRVSVELPKMRRAYLEI
jgi:superfamily II DNA or RNA helicase